MSETLEERLRVHANYGLMVTLYSSDIIELLDARDKIIAEQRAAIDEMRASDRAFRCSLFDPHDDNDEIELILLRRANAAQDSVLRRMQVELDAVRAERDEWKRRVKMAQDDDKSFYEPQLAELRAELILARLTFDSIRHAAHMPDDYKFGLPSWINQTLYACYIGAAISPHVAELVESGKLVFSEAPDFLRLMKEVDTLRSENAELQQKYSYSLRRRMELVSDLTKSELLAEGLRAENAALRDALSKATIV